MDVTVPLAAGILDFGPDVVAVHVPDADGEGPAGPAAGGEGDRVRRELADQQGDVVGRRAAVQEDPERGACRPELVRRAREDLLPRPYEVRRGEGGSVAHARAPDRDLRYCAHDVPTNQGNATDAFTSTGNI